MNRVIRIALFGLGGVGQALIKIIREENLPVQIELIVDRSYQKKTNQIQSIPATDNVQVVHKITQNYNIDLVVELMGGISTPLFIIREALDQNIPVVTANKALLASMVMLYL